MIWAGNKFEESYYVALLLIIPVCIPLIQNLGLSIMQAMNKYRFKSISTAIMSIINIIISIYFTKKWGAVGAALGTCIALIICNIFLINIYYYKVIKLDIIKFWKEIIKITIPFSIPLLMILIIMRMIILKGIIAFIVYSSIYVFIYILTVYFITMNSYEKKIVENFLYKIHIKKKV